MDNKTQHSVSDLELVDIEEYAKAGKSVPNNCKAYRIRIDKTKYVVTRPSMSGRELLILAQKTPPEQYRIDLKLCGGNTVKIGLNEHADFTAPGVERFMTLPLDQTEGYSTRRHFQLSEEDEAYLNALGLPWETITENQAQRVVIEQFPVPTGYKNNTVTVSVCIPPQYPDVQIDMAFFYPALERSDRQPIRSASVNFPFDGKQWQRWSRHRTKANPWRPGVDCLATHFGLIEEWLKKELRK